MKGITSTAAWMGRMLMLTFVMAVSLPRYVEAQTLAFPEADGFGRYATGARGHATPSVYVVTNLNDRGPGSFRDAVSQSGRFVVFAVGGIIRLESRLVVAPYTTIAGQTAPGDGIVIYGRNVSFSGASNTIARYLRIRLGANAGAGSNEDASGVANGSNIIFDHMSFSWGLDEVFSINWDNKGIDPDNITIQNSIIGQGLHRHNHSAGGLMEPGGKISLLRNLYISNKTRNPKVKGTNEFVNNVVYNYGNAGNPHGHAVSGDGYIMGGSASVSQVNIINNYFIAGPLNPDRNTPFSRGTPTFSLYASGNYYDNNKNGVLDGTEVSRDDTGYPGILPGNFQSQAYNYPGSANVMTAAAAFDWVVAHVGATYPRRDQVDQLLVEELASVGTLGSYVYRENDLPFSNGGLGDVYGAATPQDTDGDGLPDAWEEANGLDKNDPTDAVKPSATHPGYLNIEVYINTIIDEDAPDFLKYPSNIVVNATSQEEPPSSEVKLTWSDNDNTTGNIIIERALAEGAFSSVGQVATGIQTYTDNTGLLPNTTYRYRLKIVSGDKESAYVYETITTPPIPTAPEQVHTPIPTVGYSYVQLVTGGSASVSWKGSENTASYIVFLGQHESDLSQVAIVNHVAAPSHQLSGLIPGTTYFWRVDAVNDKGTTVGEVWSFKTTAVFERGKVGYWAFDETSDRPILDSSPYENHGVLGFDDDEQGVRIAGKKGGAINLSTVDPNMYPINIPHADHLYMGANSFSISFWMKGTESDLPQDNSRSAYLLCKGSITRNAETGATGKRFNVEFKNKQFRFAIDDDNDASGGGKDEVSTAGTPFFQNEWVHVVIIKDTEGKQLRIYRNGEAVAQTEIKKAFGSIGEESDLIIGNIGEFEFLTDRNAPAPYTGQLDELKIFNHVLSQEEILSDYLSAQGLHKPFSPTPATGTVVSQKDKATVSWQEGGVATSFNVYIGTASDALQLQGSVTKDQAFEYELQALQPNTPYFWRVDALADGETVTGDVWDFKTAEEVQAPRGLVARYRFDEKTGALAQDASHYANHASLENFGTDHWVADGKNNGALDFKDMQERGGVHIPHADQIEFDNSSFTLSFWVRGTQEHLPQDNSWSAYLLCKGSIGNNAETGATGKRYNIELKNKQFRFSLDDDNDGGGGGKDEIQVDGTPFFTGDWVHVVAIRDVENKLLKIYHNGVFVKQQEIKKALSGIGESTALILGNVGALELSNPARGVSPYGGQMDDLKIYNYALEEGKIAELFANRPKITEFGFVGHYKLDETSGTVVNDSSPYAHHGSLREFASDPWLTDGKYGGAIKVTATTKTGAIVVPAADHLTFDENSFTISMWMRSPENTYKPAAQNAYLIHKGTHGGVGKWYGIQLHHNDRLVFSVDDNITKSDAIVTQSQVNLFNNEWRHVVAVRDRAATKIRVYIDGELITEANDGTAENIGQAGLDLLIGNSGEERPYRDDLDDVRLYDYALSSEQVKRLYEGNPLPKIVRNISPEQQAVAVAVEEPTFVWEGASHSFDLYLGTDRDNLTLVAEGISSQAYVLSSPLAHATEYFWRVDAVLEDELIQGEVWSFVTDAMPIPVIHDGEVFTVNELSPEGTVVVQLTADTPEGEALFGWTITQNVDVDGNGVDAFILDSETGELKVNDSSDFEYVEGRELSLKVVVSNSAGVSGEHTIRVVVNFVNQTPGFDIVSDIIECYSPDERVFMITGINPGRETDQTVEMSVSSPGAGLFNLLEITQPENGVAYVHYVPKAGIHDQVAITIRAKDNGGTAHGATDTYEQTITLSISGVPEIQVLADKHRVQKGERVRLSIQNLSRNMSSLVWYINDEEIKTSSRLNFETELRETTTFTVRGKNSIGCEGEASITIEVYDPTSLEIANVITPNGDGINDTWIIKNIEAYPGNEINVFDISGRLVYQRKDYANDWNGTYQGKPLAEGTYYYVITFGSGRSEQKGYINIIRENR